MIFYCQKHTDYNKLKKYFDSRTKLKKVIINQLQLIECLFNFDKSLIKLEKLIYFY